MVGVSNDRIETPHAELNSRTAEWQTPRWMKTAGIIGFALSLLIYVLRLDRVVGLMGDDSWYVLLAQALATGQGYTLINSPTPGILPLYPPGFPFILSLAYRLYPKFPENLWLLKSVSILSMMLVGIILYRYFIRERRLPAIAAMGISIATLLCPPLVFLAASSVMSDCVFMLFTVLAIVMSEKCIDAKPGKKLWLYVMLAAAAASSAFLTRSIAIALIVAAPLYLLKHRMLRAAALFCMGAALFCGPWVAYTRLHAPTKEHQMEQGSNMVLPYTYQFWQRLAGDPESPQISASELPKRIIGNILEVSGRDTARILMTVIFEALRDPYREAERIVEEGTDEGEILYFSLFLSVFVVLGYVVAVRERLTFAELAVPMMLVVIVLWPFETIRYSLPLSPFVLFYFFKGLEGIQNVVGKWRSNLQWKWGLAHGALLVVIALHLYGNVRSIVVSYTSTSLDSTQWEQKFEEIEKTIQRVDQVGAKSDVIASTNPALITILTGRKTVGWDNPSLKWEIWKKLSVRYLAWLMVYPRPAQAGERKFKTIYLSRDGSNFRVVDLGPPEQRLPWD